MDNSNQISSQINPILEIKEGTKAYGSTSGVKTIRPDKEAPLLPSPIKLKGKNIMQENIFLEALDDSKKILGNSIKNLKNIEDAKDLFATIYRNGKAIKVYNTHTNYHKAKDEENRRLRLLSEQQKAELIPDEADR